MPRRKGFPALAALAGSLIDGLGGERMADADVSPEELAAADSLSAVGLEFESGAKAVIAEGLAACDLWSGVFVDSLGESAGGLVLTGAATECLRIEIAAGPEDQIAASFAAAMVGEPTLDDTAAIQLFLAPLERCPRVVAELLAAGVAQAGGAVDADVIDCFEVEAAARGSEIIDTFLAASADPAAGEALGAELAAACL